MHMERVCVVAVDDDPSMGDWIRAVLAGLPGVVLKVVEHVEAYLSLTDLPPTHVIILDLELPGAHGLDLLEMLEAKRSPVFVLVFTGRANVATAVRAMKSGAVDLLEKPVSRDAFIARVSALVEAARARAMDLREAEELEGRLRRLTDREREVMTLLAEGRANAEVALALGISTRTVEGHRLRLLRKTEASSVTELTHALHRLDLFEAYVR